MLDVSKVKINLSGVRAVCNQSGVLSLVQSVADEVCQSVNGEISSYMSESGHKSGYKTEEHCKTVVGRTKHNIQEVSVYTSTDLAKAMQAKHNTLTNTFVEYCNQNDLNIE